VEIFMAQNDALELHRYLQSLVDKWPQDPETWTPEQHRVSRAFLDLESSLDRNGALPR
jgi:hypothetical protein